MSLINGMTDRLLKRKSPFKNLKKVSSGNNTDTTDNADHEEIISPPPQLSAILIQQARNLQMLPDVAVKAIAIAEDPDSNINKLVSILSQDILLTTSILSLSNSVLFGGGQSISSLQTAITRLGFRQTKNLILASCFARMQKNMEWRETRIRDLLCKHSFLTGVICSRLNSLFRLGMQGEEFTAGLIHDVGRTLLAVSIPEDFSQLDSLSFREDARLAEREFQLIGTTHAEVGAWFLQRNHLPQELINAARYHHNPHESSMYKRLVVLVAIADDLANYSQRLDACGYECSKPDCLNLLESLGVEDASITLAENWKQLLESANEEVTQLMSL